MTSTRWRAPAAATLVSMALLGAPPSAAQDGATMSLEDYEPISTLVVPEHPLTRSRFPFVDAHAHFRATSEAEVDRLIAEMDAMNMAVAVNLSGGSGERFRQTWEATAGRYPGRFVQFANVDFRGIDEPGWAERTVAQLEEDVKAGASGLKIYKNLGMLTVDAAGRRVRTDDPRIDPVWAKCGELGIPVLIHTGEPSPFWEPWDERNERWLELKQYPNRRRDDATRFASFDETMAEQHDVFRKHPGTKFISAHLSWLGNDLDRLGRLLDEIPNMYTELGAVLAELGRQPRRAREFLIRHQDRVLMGKDSWEPSEYHVYFRVLETADEYFDYYRKRHAHWKMYGLDLPDEVLRKIYYQNALTVIPGLDRSRFER
ncbi:MAG TPA: amidohydrolase family protein [Thermoanaerobaculia bacterium]|nr:amidohydrolase family protein [Thermoanaerobaculia bacterium]